MTNKRTYISPIVTAGTFVAALIHICIIATLRSAFWRAQSRAGGSQLRVHCIDFRQPILATD